MLTMTSNGTSRAKPRGNALPRPCMNTGSTGTFGRALARWPMPFLNACSVSGSPRVKVGGYMDSGTDKKNFGM
jgi:hypothetical protein